AMEPPALWSALEIHAEKLKVLKALRPLGQREDRPRAEPSTILEDSVRAQYTAGCIAGKPQVGYLEEPGVPPGSTTESYVALKFFIDNWRWAGVPFYLRSGKGCPNGRPKLRCTRGPSRSVCSVRQGPTAKIRVYL